MSRPSRMILVGVLVVFGMAVVALPTIEPGSPREPQIKPMPVSPLSGRDDPTAIWTGTEMIVWGGSPGPDAERDGPEAAGYRPDRESWRSMADSGLEPRSGAAGLWTGSHAIVWGGASNRTSRLLSTGATYDPVTDEWTSLPDAPFAGRNASWDGTRLLVWAQIDETIRVASFDAIRGTWSESVAPLRPGHDLQGTWIRGRLVLASYPLGSTSTVNAAAFDPLSERWRPFPGSLAAASLTPRLAPGMAALFLGGAQEAPEGLAPNAALDPFTGEWRPLDAPDFSGFSLDHAVQTGRGVVFVGRSIAIYDEVRDRWERVVEQIDDTSREQFALAWTGDRLLIWGGSSTLDGALPIASGLIVRLDPPTE